MNFNDAKKILASIKIKDDSLRAIIRKLILEKELLHQPMTSEFIQKKLYEVTVKRPPITSIIPTMEIFQKHGIVRKQIVDGRILWYGSWYKGKINISLKSDLPFSSDLIRSLGTNFKKEFEDFSLVFNKSGTCTAFLIRKILEKATFLALTNNGVAESKLKNGNKYKGLEDLLGIASIFKIKGIPILMPKTVQKIQGIKFLGDTSAHNYLVNVEMEEIIPQLPYITIALKELAKRILKYER